MKVIKSKDKNLKITGIIAFNNRIVFLKCGKRHRKDGPAIIYHDHFFIRWCYNGVFYGFDNEFINKTWKQKVKQLKLEEKLKIFK